MKRGVLKKPTWKEDGMMKTNNPTPHQQYKTFLENKKQEVAKHHKEALQVLHNENLQDNISREWEAYHLALIEFEKLFEDKI